MLEQFFYNNGSVDDSFEIEREVLLDAMLLRYVNLDPNESVIKSKM